MEKCDWPFEHYIIKNFLSSSDQRKLRSEFLKTQFFYKYTDLFSLYQSEELNQNKNFSFFFDKLDNVFSQLDNEKEYWYTAFASFYKQGDYLLCHDDRVEFRKYAFTYYLEDYSSGELVMYDQNFDKRKVVKVEKNTLVIFKVHQYSYHEVNYCYQDGRKAITGWFNTKDSLLTDLNKEIIKFTQLINQDDLVELDISPKHTFTFLPEMIYEYKELSSSEEKPFTNRRLLKLQLKDPLLLKIKEYKLIHHSFYKIRKFDYLLLNDPINDCKNTLDLFCLRGKGRNIVFLDEDGNEVNRIDFCDGSWMVKRGDLKFFIENGLEEVFMAHFVYEKE